MRNDRDCFVSWPELAAGRESTCMPFRTGPGALSLYFNLYAADSRPTAATPRASPCPPPCFQMQTRSRHSSSPARTW